MPHNWIKTHVMTLLYGWGRTLQMPSRIWYIFRRGILFDPFDSIRIAVSFRSIVDEAIFRLQEASAASALATFHCFFLFPFIHCERAFLFNTMFTRRPVCDEIWGKSKRHYEVEHSDDHRLFCKSSRNQSIPQCGLSHFYRACRTIWSVNNNMVWIVKIPIPDRML